MNPIGPDHLRANLFLTVWWGSWLVAFATILDFTECLPPEIVCHHQAGDNQNDFDIPALDCVSEDRNECEVESEGEYCEQLVIHERASRGGGLLSQMLD
ncbi:protein of unknown function [Candidatus Filomicrobium marinum]|uniref:Uncharacterized protein n=1 Tax=Candidatus Filomicrobium marinum TaxID=1608628 RepID=A0A0D6JKU2_9HYPH|nr:protein of unknown function [Candidatus Filomicrobium marinum]CPR22589.1 protein of unknown function [Candidatus Filomicrobium marinum]